MIVIEVSGGVVQQVYSDKAAQECCVLIDYDNLREGDEPGFIDVWDLGSMDEETRRHYEQVVLTQLP